MADEIRQQNFKRPESFQWLRKPNLCLPSLLQQGMTTYHCCHLCVDPFPFKSFWFSKILQANHWYAYHWLWRTMKHAMRSADTAANEMFFQEQKTNLGVQSNTAAKNKSSQHTGPSKLRNSQTINAVDISTYIMCGSTRTPLSEQK